MAGAMGRDGRLSSRRDLESPRRPPGAGFVQGENKKRDVYLFTCCVSTSEPNLVFLIVLNSVFSILMTCSLFNVGKALYFSLTCSGLRSYNIS